MSIDILSDRVTNAAGVSVGTALALETILPSWPVFDPERPKPKPEDLFAYKRVWINLATLFRNLYNCCPRDRVEFLHAPECADALYAEMEVIHKFISDATQSAVETHFYYCDYKDLGKQFPQAMLRTGSTPKQTFYRELMVRTIERTLRLCQINRQEFVTTYATKILPKTYGKTLLMTHYPVDLLSEPRFGALALLESHTGVVKNKTLWHTKLFNGKTLSILPFCQMTLQVFGDEHHFKPMDQKIREAILDIAKKRNWSWMTSKAKMLSDVRGHPDQFFAAIVAELI